MQLLFYLSTLHDLGIVFNLQSVRWTAILSQFTPYPVASCMTFFLNWIWKIWLQKFDFEGQKLKIWPKIVELSSNISTYARCASHNDQPSHSQSKPKFMSAIRLTSRSYKHGKLKETLHSRCCKNDRTCQPSRSQFACIPQGIPQEQARLNSQLH